jgi:hypothetical protein
VTAPGGHAARLKIVNADPRYTRVDLAAPATHGYVHVAAAVRPNPVPRPEGAGPDKARLMEDLKVRGRDLQRLPTVERVTLFDAIAMPPTDRLSGYLRERACAVRPARFDVVMLVRALSPEAARSVMSTPEFAAITTALDGVARDVHVMAARAARRLGDVDTSRDGLFVFDYFVAEDARVLPELWTCLTGWYVVETGLDDATLLTPLDGEHSDYAAIDTARWDLSVPGYFARQLSKKTFRSYVHANLDANRVGAMPVLYRRA